MSRLFRSFGILFLLACAKNGVAYPATPQLLNVFNNPSGGVQRQNLSADRHGLMQLSLPETYPIIQFSHHLDILYSSAQIAQQELTAIITETCQVNHTEARIAPIKSRHRAEQKIQSKLNGNTSALTDIVRASIVADSIASLMHSYQFLAQNVKVLRLKNRFSHPKISGYRDINLLVHLPKSQMIAEVQLHLRHIADIKSGVEHQVYQQVQGIEYQAKMAERELTEIERSKIIKLQQASHKQYHKAWLYYKRLDDTRRVA